MFLLDLLAYLPALSQADKLRVIMCKYLPETIMLIDYVPFLGPLYNASYALNMLFSFWPVSKLLFLDFLFGTNSSNNQETEDLGDDGALDASSGHNRLVESSAKSRLIREKGIIAIVGALIDLGALCLTLGVMAYVSTCLAAINTWFIVRHLAFGLILSNVFALSIASKIITNQVALYATRQLEDVNHVGTSVVKSATITVTAIEKIVETTNSTSNHVLYRVNEWYTFIFNILHTIRAFPYRVFVVTRFYYLQQVSLIRHRIRVVKRNIRSLTFSLDHKKD